MKGFPSVLLCLMVQGCCQTYEFDTYNHEPTGHVMRRIEESSFDGSLRDYSTKDVLFAPFFREDTNLGGSKLRNASVHLYAKQPTSVHVSKAVLETGDGQLSVTFDLNETFRLDQKVYKKSFFKTSIRLHTDRERNKTRATKGDLDTVWGADELKLQLWVGDPGMAQKKISFELKLDHHRDIVWPT